MTMREWALINPDNELTMMSTSLDALTDMLEGFADEGEGWTIVQADEEFFASRPELAEGE